ncbi:hypothetical protein K3X48_05990 [Aliiroseovarius crassostreae]|uniref:Uncharacterized protein n=1 Tax=Aliiroseovarius crassostreae TaxID=154981 RepID=A0A9Q9LUN2_9RHOB|nr:hypothetical protein [Aliiroseovarius crassostreae]UWP96525.1 hypothetical protein K3X48_05990 [Aliiroseovarius crassostreae]
MHLNLVVPRRCVENGTVDRLRKAGKLSEEELRIVGLVEHLVEKHGYLYGAGLINALHYSMDFAGNDEEVALKAIDEAVQELIGAFSRPYDGVEAA